MQQIELTGMWSNSDGEAPGFADLPHAPKLVCSIASDGSSSIDIDEHGFAGRGPLLGWTSPNGVDVFVASAAMQIINLCIALDARSQSALAGTKWRPSGKVSMDQLIEWDRP